MNAREALKLSIDAGRMIAMSYVDDLSDADMLKRPCPGCNHVKWQMGHLIAGEHYMMEQVLPGSMPSLPRGFVERYAKETSTIDDPAQFDSKADLLAAFETQRAGTL